MMAAAEESKLAPPAQDKDVELGRLPSSASCLSLSGSVTGKQSAGGPLAGGEGAALRWNIERLAVPVRKRKPGAAHLGGLAGGGFDAHTMLGDGSANGVEGGGSGGGAKPGERNILYKVVGQAEKGQMLALMGASGAGKSSLLDCISLRNHRFEGSVYLGKKPVDHRFFSSTAYVHQVRTMDGPVLGVGDWGWGMYGLCAQVSRIASTICWLDWSPQIHSPFSSSLSHPTND